MRVLEFLQSEVFEPLEEVDFKFLSRKMGLLWALLSTSHGSKLGDPVSSVSVPDFPQRKSVLNVQDFYSV